MNKCYLPDEYTLNRNSHRRCSVRFKDFSQNLQENTRKRLFLVKSKASGFLAKCFPVNIAKFQEHLYRLPLVAASLHETFKRRTGRLLNVLFTFNFIKKETLAQLFSCEFCQIFKNTFFTEHPRTTASTWPQNVNWTIWNVQKTYAHSIYVMCSGGSSTKRHCSKQSDKGPYHIFEKPGNTNSCKFI